MSYVSAVDHLHALVHDAGPSATKKKFDLGQMRTLAAALGDPQCSFASVLIAGTNGKGSTAATLASILGAAGYRVGLYTSPHLCRVTERVRVSAIQDSEIPGNAALRSAPLVEIAEDDFARLYFRVDEVARRLVEGGRLPQSPSFFEVLTSVGFLYFAERQVNIAVLEVGLGGRLDATNIVDPLISVITDVSLDHQEFLGNTITEIAREKAGILRPGGVLVTLPQHPEANSAIGEIAMELGVRGVSATGYLPGRDPDSYLPGGLRLAAGGGLLYANEYELTVDGEALEVRSPLAGRHQQRNIALAISVANELRENHRFAISNAAIAQGIRTTAWPGRLEFIAPDVLVDVAHNPAGAWTLRAAIAGLPEDLPRTLLFSCLREKNLAEIAQILFPLFDRTGGRPQDHLVFAPIENPRAVRVEDLVLAARALDVPVETASDIAEGLAIARLVTPPGGLIIATGSVYLVGALRELVLPK